MKAYHFLEDNMESGEGNEKAWAIGEEREITGEIKLCQRGYHASPNWYHALHYAPGNMACIVKVSGNTIKDTDKSVSSKRKLIDARNAEYVLREWGCDCAKRALKKARVTDERSWNTIKVARLYNKRGATKEELAAAWAAARDAAWAARDAAWDAAWAARDAAWAAARDAAWDAAWAARAAARAAARDAARDAEFRWQKRHLNKLMKKLFNEDAHNDRGYNN